MPDESALIESLRRCEPDSFTRLFEAYSDRIYRLAVRFLNDPAEAEEIVQDTFLTICEKIDSFEGRSKLGTWIYRIAANHALMRLRTRKRVGPSLDNDPGEDDEAIMPGLLNDWSQAPESITANTESIAEMERAIAALPDALRTAFVLRDLEELSTEEAAETLGISPGALKVRLHRARLLLREKLSAYFAERVTAGEE
ncbi:MAG TPA: sigma-70 family RNA polymerase sigma factor [Anaerolineae bacterium]|nr:sigma-70 family RNA polymerase sigma factor [Anaerolineae bacterium]